MSRSDHDERVRTRGRNVMSMYVDKLDLTVRAFNCLRGAGIERVSDLVSRTAEELLAIPNMGDRSIGVIESALDKIGLRLGMPMNVDSDDHASNDGDVMSMDVGDLDLTNRALKCLRDAAITHVGDLVQKTPVELLTIPDMGATGVRVIEMALEAVGLRLRSDTDFDAFVRAMQLLGGQGVNGVEEITSMTADELLALPGFDRETLEAVERGLERWGLHLDDRSRAGRAIPPSDGEEGRECSANQPDTLKDELSQVVTKLLADERGVSSQCFLRYHGIDGDLPPTLQEIGHAGHQYGFENSVTRERVRQVLVETKERLRKKRGSVRFVRWESAEQAARDNLPESVDSFISRFGYQSTPKPERIFTMLELCAGIFGLKFPFALLTFTGIGTVITNSADDTVSGLVSGLKDHAKGPYSGLKETARKIDCEEHRLKKIIDVSLQWEFLDGASRYFWKRPQLPPSNYGVTGNAILTSLCKIFSVTTRAATTDLACSVARDRILRKVGPMIDLPVSVLEGIADRSGLFDVHGGQVSRRGDVEWCVIGRRDIALLEVCVEHGRVVPSHLIYSSLLRSGLTRENAAVTVAYSPFLVHTQSGVGDKEGIYKFVPRAEDIDLDALRGRVGDSDDVEAESELEDEDSVSASEACFRIPVSSRTMLSGRFFASEPLGLDGEWDVQDRGGVDICRIVVFGRNVSGLKPVVAALGLKRDDVLEMRLGSGRILVAGS